MFLSNFGHAASFMENLQIGVVYAQEQGRWIRYNKRSSTLFRIQIEVHIKSSLGLVTPPSSQSFIRCLVHMLSMNENSSNATRRGIKIFVGTPASKIYVPIV